MREIIFRGKTMNDGKWVYGSLINMCDRKHTHYCILEQRDIYYYAKFPRFDSYGNTIPGDGIPVIPETIGQWTGLVDKNGTKIFEGDIVDRHGNGCGFHPITIVRYFRGGFSPFAYPGWECTPEPEEVEVIGNIYDNPASACEEERS